MAAQPSYESAPNNSRAALSVANTATDGTGTIATLWTPGGSGGRVDKCQITAKGTTVAGAINFFTSDDSGATWKYFGSMQVDAAAVSFVSPVVLPWQGFLDWLDVNGLPFKSTERLGAATTVAQAFEATTFGGDF